MEPRSTPSRRVLRREAVAGSRLAGLTAVAFAILVGLGGWRGVAAQDAEVTIQVVPAAVSIPADGPVPVQVVIRNRTDHPIDEIELSWFSDGGVDIQVDTTERLGSPPEAATSSEGSRLVLPQPIAPKSDRAWTAHLWRAPSGPLSGTVHFRAAYSERPTNAAGTPAPRPARRIIYADLAITPRAPDPAAQPAEIAIDSTLTALNEQRDGWVFLRVTNTSQTLPIRIGAVRADSTLPDAIVLRPEVRDPVDPNAVWMLGPGESRAISVEVEVDGAVQPGKQLLVFDVPIVWDDAGRTHTDHLVATHEVDVGVFGESEILTLLAVPSFFLLPGFLAVLAFGLLWVRLGLGTPGEGSPLKVTTQGFWLLAISISLVLGFAYPLLTRTFLAVERDYRSSYSAWDVAIVWFGAILVGLALVPLYLFGSHALSSVWQGLTSDARRLRDWYRAVPSPGDKAIKTLEKMAKRDERYATPRRLVDFNTEHGSAHGFRVVVEERQSSGAWVAPLIVITWLKESETKTKIQQELRKKEGSAKELAGLLRHGVKNQELEVEWKLGPAAFSDPVFVSKDKITEGNLGHIFEEAAEP